VFTPRALPEGSMFTPRGELILEKMASDFLHNWLQHAVYDCDVVEFICIEMLLYKTT
jgi:hypothetical protein